MPNSLSATGLTTATQAELITYFTAQFQSIYGADINLASDTPDGQLMNIFIQAVIDLEDLLTQIYNTFDPDNAIGVVLDQRVAINGIQRQAGTFTTTYITIVTSQSVNLPGIDQESQVPYTVADASGNNWGLITSVTAFNGGALLFQAENPGAVLTTPNTINIPVTIVLGVTSVNNPTTYQTLGINEETDAALKVRRQQSVSLASQGYLAGLLAALENVSGVTSAFVYENTTSSTNGYGIPGHSIWVIVAGTGSAANIAQAIYDKRNAGCGMKGSQSYVITQVDGSQFVVYWDDVTPVNLFAAFYVTSINGINPPNLQAIIAGLPSIFTPGAYQEVNINELATLIQQIDPNTLVTFSGGGTPATGGFSTSSGGTYTNILLPGALNDQFVVSAGNMIGLPMQLLPYNAISAIPLTVAPSGSLSLTGVGGYSTLTYSFVHNNSGGTINSSSGLYTAGTTGNVQDTVAVTDTLGNTAQAVIQVS